MMGRGAAKDRRAARPTIREVAAGEEAVVDRVVSIHLATFEGFFLTFLGKGFLRQMYLSYCEHGPSGLLVAEDGDGEVLGFLAYSFDMSSLYRSMIRHRLPAFAWYGLGGAVRRPSAFVRLCRAFLKPSESARPEPYVELSSIGVDPSLKSRGVGSALVDGLKGLCAGTPARYISLETDARDNEGPNAFYVRNGFVLEREYSTPEGRAMNEYRFPLEGVGDGGR